MRVMKDSGIEWIGEIPDHWTIIKNKYLFKFIKGKNPETLNSEKIGLPYIGASDLDKNSSIHQYQNYCNENIPMCSTNDILILWDGARAGIIGIGHYGYLSSTVMAVSLSENNIPKFVYWYFKAFEKYLFDQVHGTTIPHMSLKYIYDIMFLNIDIKEQQKIANYLDKKVSEIDGIITKTKQSIEEYKKYKQSLITETVTKGLNPNAKMKDSGIEWIGEIPDHWELRPVWTLFTRKKLTGHADKELLSVYRDYGVIKKNSRDDNHNKESEDLSSYQLVLPDDLVINKMKAWQGSLGISELEGIVSPAYFVYKSKHKQNNKFIHYLMRSPLYASVYMMYSIGIRVAQWDLDPQQFSRMPVILPPIKEQQRIVEFLDKKLLEIPNFIAKKELLINELESYKKSLIYEVVTGKKEV